jgi:hypothetical protein
MARRKSLRSELYRGGPGPGQRPGRPWRPNVLGERVVRRKVYRTTNGINRRVLKILGCR